MIQKISEKLADFVIKEGFIDEKNRDVLVYGNILLISDVVNFFVIIAMGLLFDKLICSLVFFSSFVILRGQTGGYHAKTNLGCNMVLGINTALVMTAVRFFGNSLKAARGLLIISVAFGLITFMLFAPREHENKKLEQYSKDILKKRSIIVWLIMTVLQVVLLLSDQTEYSLSVGLSMVSVSLALLV
ncbi:MAG: accessory gene regulator B family protein [Lachnospiraceae bacterium]|nr:accessory gene regulator B family protein [Lachnospiraceae bacterium]